MRRTVTVLMVAAATLLPARTLTVDDLIGIALRHSPDVDLGRYGVEGARALQRSVRSVRLPHVDLSVRLERERDQYRHAPDTTTDTLEGTLSATQLLYDFGKSAGTIESAAEGWPPAGKRCVRSSRTRSWRSRSATTTPSRPSR